MKTLTLLTTALILAAPLAAQTAGTGPQRLRKQDGTGTGTPTATQQRLRDGSCGNPNPSGSRGANAQGARRGQGR